MPTYYVTIPCTMAVAVTVEADNEQAAIDAAFDLNWNVELKTYDKAAKAAAPECVEVEMHRQIVQGNVYHGCINEPDVEEY